MRPNGWVMIFDYAISDPRNSDTVGIRQSEIGRLFANMKLVKTYRLILAPPLLRKIPRDLLWVAHAVETMLPLLCTHRLYLFSSQ